MYILIAVLGIYILYKGAELLVRNETFRQSIESSTLPKNAEDAAVRTYAPGYAAAVENKKNRGWLAELMEPLVPVYSYISGMDVTRELEVNGEETEDSVYQGQASGQQEDSSTAQRKSDTIPLDENAENDRTISEERPSDTQDSEYTQDPGIIQNDCPSEEIRNMGENSQADHIQESETKQEKQRSKQNMESGETEEVLEAAGMGGHMDGGSLLTEQLKDFDYLLANYYTLDAGTSIDSSVLDVQKMLTEDLSIRKNPEVPQILIYHTHSQETFVDSRGGEISDSIVGMGEVLAELLRTKYGYQVIHDTGTYDLVNGVLDRSAAYDYARESIQKVLEENPDIEVVIDLHRDGVDGQKFVTEIDGKPCSMIMFFNGLSRDEAGNPLTWLDNPCLEDNLAFSLQLQLKARQQYPGYTRNIYLKAERFNLHLRPRSLLIEAGTQLNTVEEEQNAMEPLADLLNQVLSGV